MATQIYGPKKLVWVIPFTGSIIKYGFMTGTDEGTRTALGQATITAALPEALVLGANAPKPPRAKKRGATGFESSFVSADKIADARSAGWQISPGKIRIGSSGAKSKTVYVTHQGMKFAWRMPMFLHAKISADLAGLGIVVATSTDKDMVFGARYPRLPKVTKMSATFESYTTFCDPSKLDSLPAGWSSARASEDSN